MRLDPAHRRSPSTAIVVITLGCLLIAGCGTSAPAATPMGDGSATLGPDAMAGLIAAAQAEGSLTTIGLPHDECNYGEVIQTFKDRYGIAVNELDPVGSSGDQIEAIEANKDNPGPQAPDVVDLAFTFSQANKDLFEPYKVSTWASIPDTAKAADGTWYGDHYSVISFTTNTAIQADPPDDWSDLLKPAYKGQVALGGDPRTSNQAIQAVYASALANGGSLDDARPGLEFWKKVVDVGNFVALDAGPASIVEGSSPIALRWSYNGLLHRDLTAGSPTIDVTVPTSGRLGGIEVQAISRFAPHPNAARLWMEFLYSDEGQLLWLKGYCYPIRYDDLVARGAVPQDLAAKVPEATGAVFPSPAQLAAATKLITEGWEGTTGVKEIAVP